jgi:two-component system sensor histidine kinase LytS
METTISYIGLLIERVSVIATLAFLLTRWTWFRELLANKPTRKTRILSVCLFSLIGIIGTYTGIVVNTISSDQTVGRVVEMSSTEAIINARVLGVAIAGIVGGPFMGLASGILAGLHRFALGGFTALACSLATIWEGLLAGLIAHYWFKGRQLSVWQVTAIGLVAEISQMLIIVTVAKPFEMAWELVKIIGVPMILANSIGLAVFFAILQSVTQREQEAVANFAHTALEIAHQTLPHFRNGLTEESARQTALIIHQMTKVAAVALTDTRMILAFVGKGADHHVVGSPLQTEVTQFVIREGKTYVAEDKEKIGCSHPKCPLGAAIVLPLRQRSEVIGTLKLYFDTSAEITPSQIELTSGLANLFSTQLELARIDEQERLLTDAEIKALQAQVNPHFLFNALNTIVALIRKEPSLARQISIQLGQFLRRNIFAGQQRWRTLEDELNHIRDYLAIETVRFHDKLSVHYDIEERALSVPMPPLILLPLVENAIKHGIAPLNRPGELGLTVAVNDNMVTVSIWDNGVGMETRNFEDMDFGKVSPTGQGTGFGLYSVIRRMAGIYGSSAVVRVKSKIQEGTTVTMIFPVKMPGATDARRREDRHLDESHCS